MHPYLQTACRCSFTNLAALALLFYAGDTAFFDISLAAFLLPSVAVRTVSTDIGTTLDFGMKQIMGNAIVGTIGVIVLAVRNAIPGTTGDFNDKLWIFFAVMISTAFLSCWKFPTKQIFLAYNARFILIFSKGDPLYQVGILIAFTLVAVPLALICTIILGPDLAHNKSLVAVKLCAESLFLRFDILSCLQAHPSEPGRTIARAQLVLNHSMNAKAAFLKSRKRFISLKNASTWDQPCHATNLDSVMAILLKTHRFLESAHSNVENFTKVSRFSEETNTFILGLHPALVERKERLSQFLSVINSTLVPDVDCYCNCIKKKSGSSCCVAKTQGGCCATSAEPNAKKENCCACAHSCGMSPMDDVELQLINKLHVCKSELEEAIRQVNVEHDKGRKIFWKGQSDTLTLGSGEEGTNSNGFGTSTQSEPSLLSPKLTENDASQHGFYFRPKTTSRLTMKEQLTLRAWYRSSLGFAHVYLFALDQASKTLVSLSDIVEQEAKSLGSCCNHPIVKEIFKTMLPEFAFKGKSAFTAFVLISKPTIASLIALLWYLVPVLADSVSGQGYWVVMTVGFVYADELSATFSTSNQRIAGTLIGIGVFASWLFAVYFSFAYPLSCMLYITVAIFIISPLWVMPYASLIGSAAIVALYVALFDGILDAQSQNITNLDTTEAQSIMVASQSSRMWGTVIGCVITVIVNYAILPQGHTRKLLVLVSKTSEAAEKCSAFAFGQNPIAKAPVEASKPESQPATDIVADSALNLDVPEAELRNYESAKSIPEEPDIAVTIPDKKAISEAEATVILASMLDLKIQISETAQVTASEVVPFWWRKYDHSLALNEGAAHMIEGFFLCFSAKAIIDKFDVEPTILARVDPCLARLSFLLCEQVFKPMNIWCKEASQTFGGAKTERPRPQGNKIMSQAVIPFEVVEELTELSQILIQSIENDVEQWEKPEILLHQTVELVPVRSYFHGVIILVRGVLDLLAALNSL